MINGVNEMNEMDDRMNGITSNTTNSLSNIMSDLESIVKIGVHIIYEELVKILRVMMSLIYGVNDLNDVSRPKGMMKRDKMTKIMTKRLTKRLTKVDTGMMEEYEINFERNRYGYPRHFPKDINHHNQEVQG
jgi:hypothetical protein